MNSDWLVKQKRLWILFPTVEEASSAFAFARTSWKRFEFLEYFQFQLSNCDCYAFVIGVAKEAEESVECLWRFQETQGEPFPDLAILAGFAGACRPGMKTGDLYFVKGLIVIGEEKIHLIKPFSIPGWLDFLDGGNCITSAKVAEGPAKEVYGRLGAAFVDMELGRIWGAFESRGITLGSIRVILDEMEDEIPAGLGGVLVRGRVQWLKMGKWVVCNPRALPSLVRLKSKVLFAKNKLFQGLNFMISRLF